MDHPSCHHCGYCSCIHHKIIPLLVLALGLLFFFHGIGAVALRTVAILWPLLIIVGAVVKLISGDCKCYKKD